MAKAPVSAITITRDSDRLLDPVLSAVDWCDELIVVDGGSTDRTLEIARAHGAKVVHRDFDGFGTQKGFAVSQARNHWVFVVDADEIVTPELRREIEGAIGAIEQGRSSFRGFDVPISLVFLGRLMRHGGEYKMRHLRLWDKRHGNYNTARVHERVVLDGPVGVLQHHMLHDSYGSIESYLDKFNHYTTAGAAELDAKGKSAGIATIVFRFPLTFLRQYIGRRHFLNGYPGFLWSMLSAMSPVVKYAKLRELHRTK